MGAIAQILERLWGAIGKLALKELEQNPMQIQDKVQDKYTKSRFLRIHESGMCLFQELKPACPFGQ